MSSDQTPARPRKRPASKPSSPPDVSRVKLTLYLPGDLAKRFAVHAEMEDLDKSGLFAEMVRTHCRKYVVHTVRGRDSEEQGTEAGDG
jgi:hypothetical protein